MPKCVIFSGAGLSAESGLDTFRDADGLWAQFDPMEVCNYKNWIDNFELVHYFYNLRRTELGNVAPNAMHKFLSQLPMILNANKMQGEAIEVIHITQNIDDLLERADAQNIIHLHGELTKIICPKCGDIHDIGYSTFTPHPCKKCGYTYLKPFVVFFYEPAPQYAKMYDIFEGLSKKDCVMVIGTSGNVVDISSIIARYEWKQKIGLKILNNLAPSPHIADNIFDKIIYKNATQTINEIKEILISFFHA